MSANILIEFFDHESLENVVSLGESRYSKVVYLYFSGLNEPTAAEQEALTSFIRRRTGADAEFLRVAETSPEGACRAFRQLTQDGIRCHIDLTGGSELFAAAAGLFAAQAGSGCVVLQQYDPLSGTQVFCHPEDHCTVRCPSLSVPEVVSLHGASLLEQSPPVDDLFFSSGLEREVLRLWSAVKDIPREWNSFCSLPAFTPAEDRIDEEKGLFHPGAERAYEKVMGRLRSHGLVRAESAQRAEDKEYRVVCLDVPEQAKFLYRQAGNLLELYTALTAVRSGLFHDCRVGVKLDWDGRRDRRPEANVKNEIDVFLTRGHRPILISCKNTQATNEFLYEISVMARHYGGRYAQAMLVSNAAHNAALRARARDMGIILIDRVDRLSQDEFISLLRRRLH